MAAQPDFHLMARRPAAIDTGLLLRAYAGAAVTVGGFITLWGPMFLATGAADQPFGRAALVRVFGAIVWAAGLTAGGLACIDDPDERRRALAWFTAAHLIVWFFVFVQGYAVWGGGLPTQVSWLLLATTMVLATADPGAIPALIWRTDRRAGTRRLRSQYERQIGAAARQEERNRLARDLHDSIKQQLFVIQTAAATVETRFDGDRGGARQALDQVRSSAREALTEMDVMLDQLRAAPLTNAGLVEALKKACEALGFRTGAEVDFRLGRLPAAEAFLPGSQEAILRIAQEALANVGRHARARHVTVSLAADGDALAPLILTVQDDGVGFEGEEPRSGMGLANMKTRAEEVDGVLRVTGKPGEGTQVMFAAPFLVESGRPRLLRLVVWTAVMTVAFSLRANWSIAIGAVAAVAVIRNALALSASRRRRAVR